MAYDYDADILTPLWFGGEDAEEPYASFLASLDPALVDDDAEQRILSTIETLRSHMELIGSRTEAAVLRQVISREIRACGSGGFIYTPISTQIIGSTVNPKFAAGAAVTVTGPAGDEIVADFPAGGDLDAAITALNSDLGNTAARAEATRIQLIDDDPAGFLASKYFLINAANDVTEYYVWYSHSGQAAIWDLDFTSINGAALASTGTGSNWRIDTPSGGFKVWYDNTVTTAPAAGGDTLVPVSFSGGDADSEIAGATGVALDAVDAVFGTPSGVPVLTVTLQTVGDSNIEAGTPFTGFDTETQEGLDAAGTDPAIGGKTGIEVAYTAGDTAVENIDGVTSTAIGALGDFNSEGSGPGALLITNAATGPTTDAVDVNTGFTITVQIEGKDAGAVPVEAFKTLDNRLGFRTTAGSELTTFSLDDTGGLLASAGIEPGAQEPKPKKVADDHRDDALNVYKGFRRGPDLP